MPTIRVEIPGRPPPLAHTSGLRTETELTSFFLSGFVVVVVVCFLPVADEPYVYLRCIDNDTASTVLVLFAKTKLQALVYVILSTGHNHSLVSCNCITYIPSACFCLVLMRVLVSHVF